MTLLTQCVITPGYCAWRPKHGNVLHRREEMAPAAAPVDATRAAAAAFLNTPVGIACLLLGSLLLRLLVGLSGYSGEGRHQWSLLQHRLASVVISHWH